MNKPVDFFKRKLVESKSFIANFVSTTSNDNENALEASYRISYRVAKALEAHTIAENVIGPCIKDVVHCMLGEKVAKKDWHCAFFSIILCHEELMTYQAMQRSQLYNEGKSPNVMLFRWMNQRMLLS
jgi:hypothetical protein